MKLAESKRYFAGRQHANLRPVRSARTVLAAPVVSVLLVGLVVAGLQDAWLVERVVAQEADLQALYQTDFRDGKFDHDELVPIGFRSLYGLQLLKPEPRGLRIIIPHHQGDNKPSVGLMPLVKIHGDFEITAGYEILAIERPKVGAGAGANLYILAEKTLHSASLRRCVTPEGEQAYFVHASVKNQAGKRRPQYKYFPAKTRSGTLRLKRVGPVLQFLVADEGSQTLRKLHEVEFGTNTVGLLRVETTTDGSRSSVENLWKDLAIRAGILERVQIPLFRSRRVLLAGTESLDGIWSVVSLQQSGRKITADDLKALRFEFSDGTVAMRIREEVIAETDYQTDLTAEPPTIRMTYEGQPTLGIFRVKGDELKICLSGSTQDRPSRFVSEPDSPNRMLIVLGRGDLGPGWPFMVANVDGTGLRQLATLPKDMGVGSPDWSPDGEQVAFDAWHLAQGEDFGDAHVYVVNADGTDLRDLTVGAMPSWSPDGKRITFCQYGPERGVWIMDADGSNQKLIDADGWGSDWSPTANEIAYETYTGGANICIVNPDTGQKRTILNTQKYQTVYWNLSWSPDGKSICFVGNRPDDVREIATASADGDAEGFKVLLSVKDSPQYKSVWPIVAWDGNPNGILAAMKGPDDTCVQLYILDPEGTEPPTRFAGQDPNRRNTDMAWSPDGKMVLFNSREPN